MDSAIQLPFASDVLVPGVREEEIDEIEPKQSPKKFTRNWSEYFTARQREKIFALELLSEAIRMLRVKTYGKGVGRPPYPLSDKIFLCIQKILRWATYDANEEFIEFSSLKKWISCKPRPHSVSDFMNDEQITSILRELIALLSTPMAEIEESFSIDSTGLSTFDKTRWVKVRLETRKHKDFQKIHTIIGNKTKTIIAANVTEGSAGDAPQLVPLLRSMSRFFHVKEFCGDAAYASRVNAQAIRDKGGFPYFKLKKNFRTLAKGYPAWRTMVRAFKNDPEGYLKRYHQRSNVESAYSMFKRKVSEQLKSKSAIAKINEAYCVVIVHNLYCLVNAVFCQSLDVKFRQ